MLPVEDSPAEEFLLYLQIFDPKISRFPENDKNIKATNQSINQSHSTNHPIIQMLKKLIQPNKKSNQINCMKTLNCGEESWSINNSVEDITPASNTLLLYQFISADLSPALGAVQLGYTMYN